MTTITLDILDDKAINLLKDLESLKVIRLHQIKETKTESSNLAAKYSGAMTKQSTEEIAKQIEELRD